MLATMSCVAASVSTLASQDYPIKPIKLVVPFPAGSGSDTTARVYSKEMSALAGQAIVVENKGGASAFIGTEQVARAQPDGYTLLLTSNTHIANKFLFKTIPYDPMDDFEMIALYKKPTPLILVVNPNAPFNTLADVTAQAKRTPGQLTFGSGNSSSRVGAELYQQLAGIDMLYVPFKGNPAGLNEVMAGRVTLMFSDVTACMGLVAAGKLRALMVTDKTRLSTLPDVPSAVEAGLPDLEIGSWGMFLAPKGTPAHIVSKVNAWINASNDTETVQRYFAANSGIGYSGSPQDLTHFMQSEMQKWGTIIERAGIEPQ